MQTDRFLCPEPGCKRTFAELWRLKVSSCYTHRTKAYISIWIYDVQLRSSQALESPGGKGQVFSHVSAAFAAVSAPLLLFLMVVEAECRAPGNAVEQCTSGPSQGSDLRSAGKPGKPGGGGGQDGSSCMWRLLCLLPLLLWDKHRAPGESRRA